MKTALYFERVGNQSVNCFLCPHLCRIPEGKRGICRVRVNLGGELIAMNYGKVASLMMDPIEKKPLHRFFPGSSILSAGTFGCNLTCDYCQNHDLVQMTDSRYELTPAQLAQIAAQEGGLGLAYTYNEPTIWYEYVLDTAKEVHRMGLKNVLVTNGYINPEPFLELAAFVDGMNIDLKSMKDEYYQKICGGRVLPVLETIRSAFAQGIHLEITTLLIPGLNTSDEDIHELCRWIRDVDPGIPLHLSRYFPAYKRRTPSTELETMVRAGQIAREYLETVILGNMPMKGV
ncbi:MAG: AmmeMemoRadiSam system radical SAM enzyme [Tissierellia bacterium]|nr:AmmeMemoRadiSam system radical SAM enzyme [Tissierellia bacterium]